MDSGDVHEDAMNMFLDYMSYLVTAHDNHLLLAPVLVDEVHHAVFNLVPDSAPGRDGFSGFFFRSC